MFEILVNGTPRTYRDKEKLAIDAGRVLKARDETTEITVVESSSGNWLLIPDPFSAVGIWKDAPALSIVRQSA
jgi:hypothetical protein